MDTLETISSRRSIRKFADTPVSDDTIRQILHAATLAPSGKNRQPWRFVVIRGEKRAEMARVMRAGMETVKAEGHDLGSSPWTVQIMEKAPVTVFIFNNSVEYALRLPSLDDVMYNVVDVQSIGAAIQNMVLAAWNQGLGTLWICDVFYAYRELCEWLGEKHQMIAAVSLGYPDEQPKARPRMAVDDVTRWL